MIVGSHNSWSYLPVKKWRMRPLRFTARCQSKDIRTQFELGVRCFDLRVRWVKWKFQVAHGCIVYDYTEEQLFNDLKFLNTQEGCMIRILHEARDKDTYESSRPFFQSFCYTTSSRFPNIHWWCGRNLYNWEVDYNFGKEPSCEEKYASVCPPKILDDWWPWLYAKFHNRKNLKAGTDAQILLIDYVNIK